METKEEKRNAEPETAPAVPPTAESEPKPETDYERRWETLARLSEIRRRPFAEASGLTEY